jgi:hypothetical protein
MTDVGTTQRKHHSHEEVLTIVLLFLNGQIPFTNVVVCLLHGYGLRNQSEGAGREMEIKSATRVEKPPTKHHLVIEHQSSVDQHQSRVACVWINIQ